MAPQSNIALSNEPGQQQGLVYDNSSLALHSNTFTSTELSPQQVSTCDDPSLAQHSDLVPSDELPPQQVPIPTNVLVAQHLDPTPSNEPAQQQVPTNDNASGGQYLYPVEWAEPVQQQVATHDNTFDWEYFLNDRVPIHGSPGLIFSSASATEVPVNPLPQTKAQAQQPLFTRSVETGPTLNPSAAGQSSYRPRPLDISRRPSPFSPQIRPGVHSRLQGNYNRALSKLRELEQEKRDLQHGFVDNSTARLTLDLQTFALKQQLATAHRKLAGIEQDLLNDDYQPTCEPGQLLALAIRARLIDCGDAVQDSA